ncbi:MAG: AzlC family ABC transporter permease [Veillonellaceae bacterium]|nr:AzlC family ABC transporter permease [Veillonellaceae bacterium]
MSREFREGLLRGIPIAIGYIPIAVAYGVLAAAYALPTWFIAASSIFIYAGASQFMVISLLAAGATAGDAVFAGAVVNLRHLLLSAAVAAKIPVDTARWQRALLGAWVTDESFSVITLSGEAEMSSQTALGIGCIGYAAWVAGTLLGLTVQEILPPGLADSMGFGLYALFIALLVPALRDRPESRPVALAAFVMHPLCVWAAARLGIGSGLTLLTAAATALVIAMVWEESADGK